MKLKIDISKREPAGLSALESEGFRTSVSSIAGEKVAQVFRDHFLKKEGDPKKAPRTSWRKTHFWSELSEKVSSENANASGVDVVVSDRRYGIHVTGGTVTPRTKKALTIPIHELAYGRRASEVPHDVFRPKGTSILAANIDGVLTPLYALVTSAKIPKDPDAQPGEEQINAALDKSVLLAQRTFKSGGAA